MQKAEELRKQLTDPGASGPGEVCSLPLSIYQAYCLCADTIIIDRPSKSCESVMCVVHFFHSLTVIVVWPIILEAKCILDT